MKSDAPKKRPWFQFHLSTAIVMMFVASGLLWANLHSRWQLFDAEAVSRGWSLTYYERYTAHASHASWVVEEWYPWRLGGNIVVGLAIILTVAVVCERLIRRKRSTDQGQLTTDH